MRHLITRCGCLVLCCGLVLLVGCAPLDVMDTRLQSPEDMAAADDVEGPSVRLVGHVCAPFGLSPARVEAVGLVVGLPGTGSDPAPMPQRAALLEEMQARGVDKPNAVLASPTTALVLIRGVLRPGIQKGDRFDIEVRIPSQSGTTSLRGGYLLETDLRQMAVLENQVHRGHIWGKGEGPILVDPSANDKDDGVLLGRGRILGGGVADKSRQIGLVLGNDYKSVLVSSRIAHAINKRFHTFRDGVKVGVAKAKTDEFIELVVHPRYRDNVARFMEVVQAVAIQESPSTQMQRIAKLRRQLFDPDTAASAAMQLEAIGMDGADVLIEGIAAEDLEVRFYSAEALAYLDRREAAEPLGKIAREEPAFRVFALSALSAMREYAAYEQLSSLLSVSSAETRYGAFRALCAMSPDDSLLGNEEIDGKFHYHILNTGGPAMIHATRSHRPEIVLFGSEQRFLTPLAVNAGEHVMVTGHDPQTVTVSRFTVGQPDQKRVVSCKVDEVIRAIVELGGTYPDIVQALQEAKAAGALASRFEIDALPEAGRTFDRMAGGGANLSGLVPVETSVIEIDEGAPNESAETEVPDEELEEEEIAENPSDSQPGPHSLTGIFARMMGRDSQ